MFLFALTILFSLPGIIVFVQLARKAWLHRPEDLSSIEWLLGILKDLKLVSSWDFERRAEDLKLVNSWDLERRVKRIWSGEKMTVDDYLRRYFVTKTVYDEAVRRADALDKDFAIYTKVLRWILGSRQSELKAEQARLSKDLKMLEGHFQQLTEAKAEAENAVTEALKKPLTDDITEEEQRAFVSNLQNFDDITGDLERYKAKRATQVAANREALQAARQQLAKANQAITEFEMAHGDGQATQNRLTVIEQELKALEDLLAGYIPDTSEDEDED